MPKKRSWSDEQLVVIVSESYSYRMVLIKLKLIPAGGNYDQIKKAIKRLNLDVSHFTGSAWNAGERKRQTRFGIPISELLVENSDFQSFKLKKRLFNEGYKKAECELCGWHEISADGRTPLELDHLNGIHSDNRLENLRILCPNCHSLQPTHRGRNKKTALVNKLIK